MSAAHTPGVMRAERQETDAPGVYHLKIGGLFIASTPGGLGDAVDEANATRIMLGWNAQPHVTKLTADHVAMLYAITRLVDIINDESKSVRDRTLNANLILQTALREVVK